MPMKTSYSDDTAKKAVPWDEERERMTPDEVKAARAKYLLDEARKPPEKNGSAVRTDSEEALRAVIDFIKEERRTVALRDSLIQAMKEQGDLYSDVVAEYDTKKMEVRYAILRRPSDKIRELMDKDATTFMTNIPLWEGCTVEQRREAMQRHNTPLDPELAELGTIDPVDFLPAASKQWVLDWQAAINTGAAFAVSPYVEYVAHSLIKRGYCLVAPNAIAHPETDRHEEWVQPGRDDMEPGSAGTPAFVRAMMGQRWLEWLLGNEQTAQEA